MTTHRAGRRHLLTTLVIATMMGLLVYLVSGITGGERGLSAARRLRTDIDGLQVKMAALDVQRVFLQKRVDALDPNHPDLDMLGEQARRVLFYAEPDEVLVTPAAKPAK